jgi:hypothetical protein
MADDLRDSVPGEGVSFDFSEASTFEAEVVSAEGEWFRLPAAGFRDACRGWAGPVAVLVTTPDGAFLALGGADDWSGLITGPVVELYGTPQVGDRVRVAISRPV